MPKFSLWGAILFTLYLGFLISLAFFSRAISSISVGLILVIGVIKNKVEQKKILNERLKNPVVIFCCLLFILLLASVFYSTNRDEGWSRIRTQSGIVAVPLALTCCDFINRFTRKQLLKWYSLSLFAALMIALGYSLKQYLALKDPSVFLYHSLVALYSGHAIVYSILVFVALLHLLEMIFRKEILFRWLLHFGLVIFFSTILFLLSSKLVITFFIAYLLVAAIRSLRHRRHFVFYFLTTVFLLLSLVLTIPNPVQKRFREIFHTDFGLITQQKFSPAKYFNGFEFRMLQWRFVPEILTAKNSWLAGVGVGDAQMYLNGKYVEASMYTGDPARGDTGFLGYNTHNELLECLLQTGIAGLVLFVCILAALAWMAWKSESIELRFATALLIAYSFTESVFESQYSIVVFLFFPLFLYLNKKNTPS